MRLTGFPAAGLLLSSQFNINYFAISEVDQWFGDFTDVWTQAGAQYMLGHAPSMCCESARSQCC